VRAAAKLCRPIAAVSSQQPVPLIVSAGGTVAEEVTVLWADESIGVVVSAPMRPTMQPKPLTPADGVNV
jgi:hypothetical protein